MSRDEILHQRIRMLVWLFIVGLFVSGVTAIPLQSEVRLLSEHFGNQNCLMAQWLLKVEQALDDVRFNAPVSVLRNRLVGVRTFYDRAGVRGGITRAGPQQMAVHVRINRVCAGNSLRICVWRGARHSVVLARDRLLVWRNRRDSAPALPQIRQRT